MIRWRAGLCGMAVVLLFPHETRAALPHPSPDTIHRQVEDILSRPEFGGDKEPQEDWFRAMVRWIGRRAAELLDWLGGLQSTAPVLFWLLVSIVILVLVLLMAYVGRKARRILYVGARPRGEDSEREKRARLSLVYREEARKWAARGDFTEAIRYLFLSLVYRFDEAGRVNFQRAYTNREYLTLFAQRPRVSTELRVFVDTLDDHWYGERPTDQDRYERCLALYEDLSR
jgi:hypothetical protein